MNAQEAIEQVEWTIEQHKQMQRFFADKTDAKQVGRYESLEKDIEALSIVLESARMLHEVLEAPTTGVIEEGIIRCFVNGSITVDKNKQKAIGIVEGADE